MSLLLFARRDAKKAVRWFSTMQSRPLLDTMTRSEFNSPRTRLRALLTSKRLLWRDSKSISLATWSTPWLLCSPSGVVLLSLPTQITLLKHLDTLLKHLTLFVRTTRCLLPAWLLWRMELCLMFGQEPFALILIVFTSHCRSC